MLFRHFLILYKKRSFLFNLKNMSDLVISKGLSLGSLNSSMGRLQDLCPQDKAKIGELMKEIASGKAENKILQ